MAALQARRVSALELTDHTIAHIETVDRRVNAVVVRDFERARNAAKAADTALLRGETRGLLGVPMTVKESFNIAGLPTTWGVPQFKGFMPKEDALIVSRVKNAGAVILGKTNVPLMLSDWQSYNDIYGTTNNPWDLGRTPGGSRAARRQRLPAALGRCSLARTSVVRCAHQRTIAASTLTSRHWVLFPVAGRRRRGSRPCRAKAILRSSGPMAGSAADLALALDVIAGPDEERAGIGYRLALRCRPACNSKNFRVLVIDTHPLRPTASAVRTALGRLSERLAHAGVKVARASPLLPRPRRNPHGSTRGCCRQFGGRACPRAPTPSFAARPKRSRR